MEERLKRFFKEEDKILRKGMDKVTYLMVSRGINQNEEREELIALRDELLNEVKEK